MTYFFLHWNPEKAFDGICFPAVIAPYFASSNQRPINRINFARRLELHISFSGSPRTRLGEDGSDFLLLFIVV